MASELDPPMPFLNALQQGVFENNRRLARTLAEWGGPLDEGQLRDILQNWAFGTSLPMGLNPPESLPVRPAWRNVPPANRTPFGKLPAPIQQRWVDRLSQEIQAMATDHPKTLARYAERPDTQNGRIVSGDTLLHLVPGVAENPPLALAVFPELGLETLAGLSKLMGRIRDRAFDLAGSDPVILMAGGNASGKTTFSYQLIRQGFLGAIVDSPWVAESDVRKVLNRRREPWVIYVERDFEEAFLFMVLRAADEGRMVDPSEIARTHAEVPAALLRAMALFRNQPRVSCWHLQNNAPNLSLAQAIGGPLHRDGKDALISIRMREESRSRSDFEQAARTTWNQFKQAVETRHQNPYPADLAHEIESRMP